MIVCLICTAVSTRYVQECVRSVRWWTCLQQTTPCVVRLHFCFNLQWNPEIGTMFLFMASVANFCSGQSGFFLQSNSMWKTPLMKKDILRIRGENDTGTQCAQTCFLICTQTLRASLLWSTSLRHPHRGIHPQASITRFILWQTFLLLISVLFVKVSADQQDE